MYQNLAWYISLLVMILILGVFLFVVLNSSTSRGDYDSIIKKWYKFRTAYFFVLLAVMITVSYVTLSDLPFDRPVYSEGENPAIVDVKAIQFGWEMSQKEFKVGEPIEFQVTSADVNHGFGIYDDKMNLLAQTQAMPGYKNNVYFTFDKPGTYQILCMEYCGLGHHVMLGEITVVGE